MTTPDAPAPADDPGDARRPRWIAEADAYDAWFDQPWGRYAFGVERAAVLDAAGDLAGRVVADVGCGTGRFTAALASAGARVVGLDPDRGMLRVAARRLTCPLLRGDGRRVPLRDAVVDVAVATTVLEFVDRPDAVVAEMARICRPGGRVVVGALQQRSPWGYANRHQFDQPPWSTARFLTTTDLQEIGRPHGTVTVRHSLYLPGAAPMAERWGGVVERLGPIVAPSRGAFAVLTVDR